MTIREIEWDGGSARLLPQDRERIIAALRATADFSGWDQANDARAVLAATFPK